jgi:hypothetical protein
MAVPQLGFRHASNSSVLLQMLGRQQVLRCLREKVCT